MMYKTHRVHNLCMHSAKYINCDIRNTINSWGETQAVYSESKQENIMYLLASQIQTEIFLIFMKGTSTLYMKSHKTLKPPLSIRQ